jgi:hypothetical protein
MEEKSARLMQISQAGSLPGLVGGISTASWAVGADRLQQSAAVELGSPQIPMP